MINLTRRKLLASGAFLATSGCLRPALIGEGTISLDGLGLADAIRRKHRSAEAVIDATIAKIQKTQPKLNFLVTDAFDQARSIARSSDLSGPFANVPILVKDLNDVKGLPTRFGSRAGAAAPAETKQNAYMDAISATGVIVLGKSATPEMGYLPTTEPLASGPTRNPWNTTRSCGGSSGGAAVAVAAGVVPLAHANDGGGSIRIPASCCGIFGLKPSRGRMVREANGASPIDFAVQHCVTRSVRDSAAMLNATESDNLPRGIEPVGYVSEPLDRTLRIGVVSRGDIGLEPEPAVNTALTETQDLLANLGHELVAARWPMPTGYVDDFIGFWSSGALRTVKRVQKMIGREPDDQILEPFTLGLAEVSSKIGADGFRKTVNRLIKQGEDFNRWLAGFDVVLSPVLRTEPPPLGYLAPDVPFAELLARVKSFMGYTTIHNISGATAMSVPLHWTSGGLPIGMQFSAPPGDERLLLKLAYSLEKIKPWAHLRPPVWAT